jgi:Flp pilus assembly protein TadD
MNKALLVLFLAAVPAMGDIVTLTDGTRLEGEIKRVGSEWRVTTPDGQVIDLPADKVKSLELKARGGGGETGLASLRRSVENLDDLQQIIDRYQRFIEQNKNSPTATEAEKDLAQWQQRQQAGMVKAGDKWVTPAQRDEMRAQILATVSQARDLIKQGRLKEADGIVQEALSVDPQNVSALYLRGWLLLNQNQFPAARKAFETVNQLLPNHGPTLNNLALILYRQNQFPAAMNYYDQAMASQPNDTRILANIAEALNALPDNAKSSAPVKKTQQRFEQQQAAIEPQLAQRGLKRWGSVYVTSEEYDRLQEAEKQLKQKLDAMAADYDKTKERVTTIDRDFDANNRTMRLMEARSQVFNSDGQVVQLPLPQQYYDLQIDNQKLQQERNQALAYLEQLRQAAKLEQQKVPTPRFNGVQQPFGVEATPIALPTTQPAT